MLMKARQRAAEVGLEFDITLTDIIIPKYCPILGLPLPASKPSLDRIDNTRGYVLGNVHVISWRANNLKRTATLAELIALGRWAMKQNGR